jgi:hypothetical protein
VSWTILNGIRLMFQRVRDVDLLDPVENSFEIVERLDQDGGLPVQDTLSDRTEISGRLAVGKLPSALAWCRASAPAFVIAHGFSLLAGFALKTRQSCASSVS